MDFKQIEAFISVAKLKSFSKAANEVYLSQPTISSQILNLEKELNVQLFDRSSKEVNLTPAGKYFIDYAVDMLNTRNIAVSNLVNFNGNISGTLSLSASTTPCNTIVPTLIQDFSSIYPDTTFNILEKSSGEIIEDIINLESEIGLVGNITDTDKIKSYCLLEDTLGLVSSPSLNLPNEVTINELRNYKFIMREKNSATRRTFESAFQSITGLPFKLNINCEINNLDTLVRLVTTGLGVSILSYSVASHYIPSGELVFSTIKDLPLKRYINLIINSKRTLTPTAKAFLEYCKTYFNIDDI